MKTETGTTLDIRIATTADAASIVKLAVAFRDHLQRERPTRSAFEHSIEHLLASADAEFYLCQPESEAVGYVLQRFRHSMWGDGLEATIEDLFVDPACRKAGFGARLIDYAVARARDQGCTTICLDTNEHNLASQRIYQALGFSSFSQRWGGNQLFYRLNFR